MKSFKDEKMSSSSSDDDDNLELLKEVVDSTFVNEYTRKNRQIQPKANELKSLRKIQDEDDQFNELRVTPQFQKFVAGKLVELLDKELSSAITTEIPNKTPAKEEHKISGGVKLFSDSRVYLDVDFVPQTELNHKKVRIERTRNNDLQSEAEKVREAAVEPEKILREEDVKYWAKQNTKPHFRYKANKTGELVLSDD